MSIKSKITLLVFLFSFLPISVHAGTIVRPVMNSGLVGYWDFQEGAGDMAYDKSGNLNHGTLEGDPTWTDGQIGGGLDFDGSGDHVGSTVTQPKTSISLWHDSGSGWEYLTKSDGSYYINGSPGTPAEFPVDVSDDTVQIGKAESWTCGDTLSYEGYSYETVEIGDQCWFAEDLRYDDGCSSNTWNDSEPYNACDTQGDGYDGLLYQWGAAMNGSTDEGAQGLCPDGWHIPTDEELKTLEGTVDSTYGVGDSEWDGTSDRGDDVGDNLKDEDDNWYKDTPGWVTGWNALPGGFRDTSGSLNGVNFRGYWWSSSVDGGYAWVRILYSYSPRVDRWSESQANGYSVRCLKDYYQGQIDEVRIYNRALSEGEIERLYKLTKPKIKAPTKDGLVGYWSMDEGSGTKVGDMSGQGNDGTMTNMDPATDWVSGKYGKALDFDGSDDYVEDANGENYLNGLTQATVSVWTKSDLTGVDRGFISGDSGSNDTGFSIRYDADGHEGGGTNVIKVGFGNCLGDNSEQSYLESSSNAQSIDWQHLLITWRSNEAPELYINGIKDVPTYTRADGSQIENADFLRIGTHGKGSWDGQIDEVRVYDRALSESEIETLYESGQAKLNSSQTNRLTDGLVGMWSFDGSDISGTTAYDRSGHDNHGTFLGGPQKTIGKVGQALSFDGADDHLDLGSVYDGVKSVSIYVKPEDTGGGGYFQGKLDEVRFYDRELSHNEVARLYRMQGGAGSDVTTETLSTNILSFNDTAAINIVDGVVSATGFTDPTIYIDGQAGSDIDSKWRHIVVTTGTGLNASSAQTAAASAFACGDTLSYEGYSYETVEIGDQCWMAENLNVGEMDSPSDDGTIQKYCYNDNESNCDTDGGLYDWDEMMQYTTTEGAQGICPSGWHIPTDSEWHSLEDHLTNEGNTCDGSRDGSYDCDPAGSKLAGNDAAGEDWESGTLTNHSDFDSSGFNASPAGGRSTIGYYFFGRSNNALLWSSSDEGSNAWYRSLHYDLSTVRRTDYDKASGFSVRCLKN